MGGKLLVLIMFIIKIMITLLLTALTLSLANGQGRNMYPVNGSNHNGNPKLEAPIPMSSVSSRIAGGHHIMLGQVPYIIQIKSLDTYRCAGALVDGLHLNPIIVTTANCVTMPAPDNKLVNLDKMYLYGGKFHKDDFYFYEQVTQPSKIVRHQDWERKNQINDLAIIFLKKDFQLNRLVNTIVLPNPKNNYPPHNAPLTVAGWGLEKGDKENEVLQVFRLPTLKLDDCYNAYYQLNYGVQVDKDRTLCGWDGQSDGYNGMCKGDWGSPARAFDNGEEYFAGIFSWTEDGCGKHRYPALFQKISWFTGWILEKSTEDPKLK